MPIAKVAEQPSWLLTVAHARSQSILQSAFAEHGLEAVHFRALAALEQYGALTHEELSVMLRTDQRATVATLKFLASHKMVERRPDTHDRRRKVIALTEAGGELLPQLDEVLRACQEELMSPLDPAERTTLIALLAKLG